MPPADSAMSAVSAVSGKAVDVAVGAAGDGDVSATDPDGEGDGEPEPPRLDARARPATATMTEACDGGHEQRRAAATRADRPGGDRTAAEGGPEVVGEGGTRRVTGLAILGHGLGEDRVDGRRQLGSQGDRRRHRVLEVGEATATSFSRTKGTRR